MKKQSFFLGEAMIFLAKKIKKGHFLERNTGREDLLPEKLSKLFDYNARNVLGNRNQLNAKGASDGSSEEEAR
jgi:hypothetical protein